MSSDFTFTSPQDLGAATQIYDGTKLNYHINRLTRSLPAKITVSKVSSTYYAYKDDGTLVSSGSNAATVIQAALDGLTSGRDWKETVRCKGEFEISTTLKVRSYTILDIDKLVVANSTNVDAIQNYNKNTAGDSHIEVHVGELDGNRSGQGAPESCGGVIMSGADGDRMVDIRITGYIHNCYRSGVHLRYSKDYVIDVLSTDNGTDSSLDHNVYVLRTGYGQIRGVMKDAAASGVKISDASSTNGEMITVDVVSYSNGDNGVTVGDSDHVEVLGVYKENDTGIRLANCTKCKVNAISTKNNQYGIYVSASSYNEIDAISMNNGQTTASRNGLHITDASMYTKVTGIYSDDQATPTQSRGIREGGGSDYTLISNVIAVGNIDTAITLTGAHSEALQIMGVVTESSGAPSASTATPPVTQATGAALADIGVRSGIVSAFVFAGNANDTVASNNLTENGTPTYTTGIFGQCVVLNGTSQYLTASANTVFDQTTGDFSISFWIYHTADEALNVEAYVVSKRSASSAGYSIFLVNDKVRAETYQGSGSLVNTTSSATLEINTWYHVIVTWDRDGLCTIYINGVANGTAQSIAAQAGSLTNTQTFTIGRKSSASESFLAAQIDDLRIYNTALTAAQAARLFEVSPGALYICNSTGSGYTAGKLYFVPLENTGTLTQITSA